MFVTTGEKKDACVTSIILFETSGGKDFTLSDAIAVILKNQNRIRYKDKERGITGDKRRELIAEDAVKYLKSLRDNGYIEYVNTRYPDKYTPNIPKSGIAFWRIAPIRLVECQNTKWYKSRKSRIKNYASKSNVNFRVCRVLIFLHGIFGNKPFTYDMIKQLVTQMKITSNIKTQREKELFRNIETVRDFEQEDFLRIWNTLLRNNYIYTRERRKTKKALKSTDRNTEYVLNTIFVKNCYNLISNKRIDDVETYNIRDKK